MFHNTTWPADAVEFCPSDGLQDILVCGTYRLEPTQRRRGKCIVFRLSSQSETAVPQAIQAIDLPAVPDLKWCPRSSASPPVLAVADSEGALSLFEWRDHENRLASIQRLSCAPDDVLCLSIDWSNRRSPNNGLGNLITSLSDGSLSLLRPCSQGELVVSEKWHAHDHEPWIAAWNYYHSSIIYSGNDPDLFDAWVIRTRCVTGGDDLKMKGWDERQGFHRPLFVNNRFDAGVTTIQSHPHIEHLIAVGSYDDKVRLFDARKPLIPLTDVDVGGGAWRVKWHPSAQRKHDLLVACMHDGFKVVRFDPSSHLVDVTVIKRFDQHESLAYGVDWSYSDCDGNNTLIASCSFYDCALHLWRG